MSSSYIIYTTRILWISGTFLIQMCSMEDRRMEKNIIGVSKEWLQEAVFFTYVVYENNVKDDASPSAVFANESYKLEFQLKVSSWGLGGVQDGSYCLDENASNPVYISLD